jgi:hypothetical protein
VRTLCKKRCWNFDFHRVSPVLANGRFYMKKNE